MYTKLPICRCVKCVSQFKWYYNQFMNLVVNEEDMIVKVEITYWQQFPGLMAIRYHNLLEPKEYFTSEEIEQLYEKYDEVLTKSIKSS